MSRWDRFCDWFEGHGERDFVGYLGFVFVVLAAAWFVGAIVSWL